MDSRSRRGTATFTVRLIVVAGEGNGAQPIAVIREATRGAAIRLYLNQGADAEPQFGKFTYLEAGDSPIRLNAG